MVQAFTLVDLVRHVLLLLTLAILIALALSSHVPLLLLAYTGVLHLVESNVLVPRITRHAVGLTMRSHPAAHGRRSRLSVSN